MNVKDILDKNTWILHSRIDVSKNISRDFIKQNNLSLDMAVATFSNDFVLESPFSPDSKLSENVINSISSINYGGWSSIYSTLKTFSKIYQNTHNINIIIFSDMEFFDEEEISSIKFPYNAKIYLIWVWTESGWNMILHYDSTWKPVYKQFKWQNAVSKLSKDYIKKISKDLNSRYYIVSSIQDYPDFLLDFSNFDNNKNNINFVEIIAYILLFIAIFITIYPYEKNKK